MVCGRQMDRWTDGETDGKSDIEVGAPPKNYNNGNKGFP